MKIESEPWPKADQLFKRDSRWRGSDAANSIDLGNGRVLWTFGDSFIDTSSNPSKRHRKNAKFIRNSVAIQIGYDPTSAEFHPYWQEGNEGLPSAFFRSNGEEFYWPGGGLMLDDKLLVFLMRIRNSQGRMGFVVAGWGAVLVANPQDKPTDWKIQFVDAPPNDLGVMVGSGSSLLIGNWVYSFGSDTSRRHQLFLTRLLVTDALAANFSNLQWWNSSDESWQEQSDIDDQPPTPIVKSGQTEFTVHYQPHLNLYLLTQFESFPRSPIAIRHSEELTGPWSPLHKVLIPGEATSDKNHVMLYAAKSHPEQTTNGLAVTYCTNSTKRAEVVKEESIYYPRFVRFHFTAQADEVTQ